MQPRYSNFVENRRFFLVPKKTFFDIKILSLVHLKKLALLQLDQIKKNFAKEFYIAYMFIVIFTAVLILKIKILLDVMIELVCIVKIY